MSGRYKEAGPLQLWGLTVRPQRAQRAAARACCMLVHARKRTARLLRAHRVRGECAVIQAEERERRIRETFASTMNKRECAAQQHTNVAGSTLHVHTHSLVQRSYALSCLTNNEEKEG